MKKVLTLLVLSFAFLANFEASAQNIQAHYDFGETRKYITTTFEYFRPAEKGETFMFVDFDYNMNNEDNKQMSLAYWEISHKFYLNENKLNLHVEYNDGFFAGGTDAIAIDQAFLLGMGRPFSIGGFFFHPTISYKFIPSNEKNTDFQFTLVWFKPLFDGKVMFNGFLDIWTDDSLADQLNPEATSISKQAVFLTEPQIWYNVNDNFAVGGEVEISKGFAEAQFDDDWMVNTTLGVKYTF
ncbi:DUF5020 family protein [Sediminitomix flava]|nr:DUF5020 family protein [Sediminitomix flava]